MVLAPGAIAYPYPMRALRFAWFVLLVLAVGGFVRWQIVAENSPASVAPVSDASAPAASVTGMSDTGGREFLRGETLARLAYAQKWDGDLSTPLAAFRTWTERYRATTDRPARAALEAEGVVLARARRPEMLALIKTDPARALALTVPAVVRAVLPAAVRAELETRVAGRGDFMSLETTPSPDDPGAGSRSRRVAVLRGATYVAHPYGRREGQLTKEGASLHGVALDGHLALHESPLRALEPGETVAVTVEDPHCPVSGSEVATSLSDTAVNVDALAVAEAFGRTWEFCRAGDDMLAIFERQLAADEDGTGSSVAPPGGPQRAAAALTSRTSGTQRVIVLRVDFSDFPGESVSAAAAQTTMDEAVKPFFEESSYGQTTLATTVTSAVYRLPQTASAYALADNEGQMHTDARALAAVDYPVANFDRVILAFTNIGTSRIPGSKITFGGEGSVGGSSVWINGGFSFRILAHELGHTFGLKHANLWQVADGNPVSNSGTSAEYKDPFDAMGDLSSADSRFHYNMWDKNRLGWLADSAVTSVTTSGTYRVYRYDHKDALTLKQPLALRIFRDGVRSYWVGLRQNFTANASLSAGAYVVWGTNNLQQTHLLDLTTPGSNSADAALAVGATFADPVYGITIKPVAGGGTGTAQYLDVEVTMPAAPPNVVAAWGRENVFFYDGSGVPITPASETFVPMGLTGVTALALGDLHGLAVTADGSVTAWGDNTNNQIIVPSGLAGSVVAVAAGGNVSGVVKRDGTVQLWGEANNGVTTPPAGLVGVKQLVIGGGHSVGTYHALALKADGTVVGWGSNSNGQLAIPTSVTNVVSLAAGDRLSVAVKSDGTVVRWGLVSGSVAFPTGLGGVSAVASGGGAAHVLALKTDGTVAAWGNNGNGQSVIPAGLRDIVGIAVGNFHSLALKSDGTVVGWGSAASGKLDVPPALPRAYALAGGGSASFALTGPHVYLLGQPQSQTVADGGGATLSVSAVGSGALSYQWRKDGVAIAGATRSTLALAGVTTANSAAYDAVVSDATSTLTTFPARLTVLPPNTALNPGRLINLSILTTINVADPLFTVGTVIGGVVTVGSKPILVRAAGPSLSALNVTTAMSDPKLDLFSGQTVVATNDNWGGAPALSSAFVSVGAFPYAGPASRDAAVYNPTLATGNYTVQVSGVGGSTGTVIAELYDATPAGIFVATTPRLINVSVLKQINAGEILTAGFVVGGSTAKQILIRAVGPTLGVAPFGIPGVMLDPKLDLYLGQTVVNTNDNWGGGGTLANAFVSVGAFALGTASRDAAILVTLQPGSYTAQVSGVANTGGLTLVEVYEVP